MIFKTINELVGTEREAVGNGWASRRFLIAEDWRAIEITGESRFSGTRLRSLIEWT
jgi:hypothetical protein